VSEFVKQNFKKHVAKGQSTKTLPKTWYNPWQSGVSEQACIEKRGESKASVSARKPREYKKGNYMGMTQSRMHQIMSTYSRFQSPLSNSSRNSLSPQS
jgi:hypothetical protein